MFILNSFFKTYSFLFFLLIIIAVFFFLLFAVTVALTAAAESSATVADTLNVTVLAAVRTVLAYITNIFPFSVFEILIILSPAIVLLIIVLSVRAFRRGRAVRYLVTLTATVAMLFSFYQLTIGISYNTTSVGDRLGIDDVEVDGELLDAVLTGLVSEINELSGTLLKNSDGTTDPGYDLDRISSLVVASYEKYAGESGFAPNVTSRAKPMLFSSVMTMLELTGIYFPYTGEANVNTLHPTYSVAFTAAHELSHQRGVMRENEANFMAFLITYTSDDDYLRYSAAMNMFSYIGSALYKTDPDRYRELYLALPDCSRADFLASRAVSEKYENSFLAELSERVNDWFLKSNGTPGVVSYGMVVKLAASYLSDHYNIAVQ